MDNSFSKQQLLIRCFILFGLSLLDGAFTYYGVVRLKIFDELNPVIVFISEYIGITGALCLVKGFITGISIMWLYHVFHLRPALITVAINLLIIVFVLLDIVWIILFSLIFGGIL